MPTEKNIKSPEQLYKFFEQYKEECKKNPKKENIYSHKADKQVSIDREVPITWNGFEIWLRKNKHLAKLDDYKANKEERYSEYADIIRTIDTQIYEDKYSGAVAGIYQHNIIARDLGLSEKQEHDHKSTDKSMSPKEAVDLSKLPDKVLKEVAKSLAKAS